MLSRQFLSSTLLGVPALLMLLAFPTGGRAQEKPKQEEKKQGAMPKKPHLPNLAKAKAEELHFEEAQALRTVLLLLIEANADYNGHRVKALKQVESAIKSLDAHVLKHGTAQHKDATNKGNAAITKAVEARQEAAKSAGGPVIEARKDSDAQLGKAGEMLAEIQTILVNNKQKGELKHVDNAIKEIKTALRVN
jgi:hypothetical protein